MLRFLCGTGRFTFRPLVTDIMELLRIPTFIKNGVNKFYVYSQNHDILQLNGEPSFIGNKKCNWFHQAETRSFGL